MRSARDRRGRLDLAGGYGTMRSSMSTPRWLPAFVLAASIGLAALAAEARAQVFRPRTGKGAPALKAAAPAPAAAAAARKATPGASVTAATPSKAPARASSATTPRRAAKKKHAKARGDSDVTINDEDDEDVKITDD
jgi:hypothetical protein